MKKKSFLGLAAWTMCAVGVQADDVMLLHTYNNETQRIVVDNIANIRHSQGQVIISLHEGDEVTLPIQEVKSIISTRARRSRSLGRRLRIRKSSATLWWN